MTLEEFMARGTGGGQATMSLDDFMRRGSDQPVMDPNEGLIDPEMQAVPQDIDTSTAVMDPSAGMIPPEMQRRYDPRRQVLDPILEAARNPRTSYLPFGSMPPGMAGPERDLATSIPPEEFLVTPTDGEIEMDPERGVVDKAFENHFPVTASAMGARQQRMPSNGPFPGEIPQVDENGDLIIDYDEQIAPRQGYQADIPEPENMAELRRRVDSMDPRLQDDWDEVPEKWKARLLDNFKRDAAELAIQMGLPTDAAKERKLEVDQGNARVFNEDRKKVQERLQNFRNWEPKDWVWYHEKYLPYPITPDLYEDDELLQRAIDNNERVTGEPYLGNLADKTRGPRMVGGIDMHEAMRRRAADKAHAKARDMITEGFDDPDQYRAYKQYQDEQDDWEIPGGRLAGEFADQFVNRSVAAGRAAKDWYQELFPDSWVSPPNYAATRNQQRREYYREQVKSLKDADSIFGKTIAGGLREGAGVMGGMAPSLIGGAIAGAVTKNPVAGARAAYAIMGGQSGLEEFGRRRAEGWSFGGATLYGAATGAVETLSELPGGWLASSKGIRTLQEAVVGGKKLKPFLDSKSPLVRRTVEGFAGSAGEGGEELLANMGHAVKDAFTFGSEAPPLTLEDQVRSFSLGAIAGGYAHAYRNAIDAASGDIKTERQAYDFVREMTTPDETGVPAGRSFKEALKAGPKEVKEGVAGFAGDIAAGIKGMGNLKGMLEFIFNPTPANATKAGIPPRIVKNKAERESLASDIRDFVVRRHHAAYEKQPNINPGQYPGSEILDAEQELYRNFYSSPGTALLWAKENPEAAAKLAAAKDYTPQTFQEADPDLPAYVGGDAATLRKKWQAVVRDVLSSPEVAAMYEEGLDAKDGMGWQKLDEGQQVPDHPGLEVRETAAGTFVRVKKPGKKRIGKAVDLKPPSIPGYEGMPTVAPRTPSEGLQQPKAPNVPPPIPTQPAASPGPTEPIATSPTGGLEQKYRQGLRDLGWKQSEIRSVTKEEAKYAIDVGMSYEDFLEGKRAPGIQANPPMAPTESTGDPKEIERMQGILDEASPKSKGKVTRQFKDGSFEVEFAEGRKVRVIETDDATESMSDDDIRKILGDYYKVKRELTKKQIDAWRNTVKGSWSGYVNGEKIGLMGVIRLRNGIGSKSQVLRHELVHFMRSAGLLTDADLDAIGKGLNLRDKKTGEKISWDSLTRKEQEEALAQHIGPNAEKGVLDQLYEILDRFIELITSPVSESARALRKVRTGSVLGDSGATAKKSSKPSVAPTEAPGAVPPAAPAPSGVPREVYQGSSVELPGKPDPNLKLDARKYRTPTGAMRAAKAYVRNNADSMPRGQRLQVVKDGDSWRWGRIEDQGGPAASGDESIVAKEVVVDESGEERAKAGMDPRMLDVLSGNLYSGDLGVIAAKELLQNAVDSIRVYGEMGKVDLKVNTFKRTIDIEDNGQGMSRETAMKEFVDLGGSKKGADASGGFGIAKMAIMGNSAKWTDPEKPPIVMETWALRPDGKGVEYTRLTGDRDTWFGKGLKAETKTLLNTYKTGTRISIQLNEKAKMSNWDARSFLEDVVRTHRLKSTIGIELDGRKLGTDEGKPSKLLKTLRLPGGTAEVLASDSVKRSSYIPVWVLNKGLPQFRKSFYLPTEINGPRELIVDISSAYGPESDNYPFRPDREGLRVETERVINEYIRQELANDAIKAENKRYVDIIKGGLSLPVRGASKRQVRHVLIDTSDSFDKGFVEKLKGRKYIAKLSAAGQVIHDLFQGILVQRMGKEFGEGHFAGINISGEVLGVNVQAKAIYDDVGSIVFINPMAIMREAKGVLAQMDTGDAESQSLKEIANAVKLAKEYLAEKFTIDPEEHYGYAEESDYIEVAKAFGFKAPDLDYSKSGVSEAKHGMLATILAEQTASTILHEIIHHRERNEAAGFTGAITRAIGHTTTSFPRAINTLKKVYLEALEGDFENDQREWATVEQGEDVFKPISSSMPAEVPREGDFRADGGAVSGEDGRRRSSEDLRDQGEVAAGGVAGAASVQPGKSVGPKKVNKRRLLKPKVPKASLGPVAPATVEEMRSLKVEDVPAELKVKRKSVRAGTGDIIELQQPAQEALRELEAEEDFYKKLLGCLGQ